MWILTLLIVILIISAYAFITRNNNYWKQKKVPFEKPTFFFGNYKPVFSGSKHFGLLYSHFYDKFKNAAYVGLYRLWTPDILIRDPELIRNVLVKDFQSFANNDFDLDPKVDPIFASNIFSQTGEVWKKNRAAWTASMTSNKIRNAFEKINERCNVMIDHIKKQIKEKPNEALETKDLSLNFFTDAVVSSVLGLEVNSFVEKDNPYKKVAGSFFAPSFWFGLLTMTFIISPTLAKFLKIRFVPKHIENELVKMARKVYESRKTTGFHKNNSFDSILLHNQSKDNYSPTDLDIAGLIFGFLLDGTETSSGVAGFMLHFIAANPDVQKKLRDEVDQAAEANGGKLDYDTIHSLSYLDMIFSETLRLYPPALTVQRLCTKPYVLPPSDPKGQPFEVPLGMTVIIPIYSLHMDPEHFPEPEKFDPERFNDENKSKIKKFTYLPFGEGPRICIGARFAFNQTKICIANLIKNFEIRLDPKMEGKTLVIDPNFLLVKAVGGLWVTFHNRVEA
ncbi:cytochrome P450 9e2-like [Arctopsyche grandis]|uniref:cytochrome P450 9e2-like n=1 Tax=Arctopsyche grandis TaxID=121162 RepID=UPI00406D7021